MFGNTTVWCDASDRLTHIDSETGQNQRVKWRNSINRLDQLVKSHSIY